ncbi:MAG: HD domain-containing protein, partial [Sedimentisphaerales bacterium]|nr:HD domain-containing protein [Sedimentisphaerales bacterium]
LLHDIGMAPLERLYHKEEPLTPEELRKVQQHPIEGAAMLPEKIDPMVRLIVRSHHENQMASGYPDQLSPEKVNIFSRVLRVADAYSAAISATAYRPARSPLVVLYEMLHGPARTLYDPVILKVFAGVMQPFPIGAKLSLTSGQTAVVTGHKPGDPFHPKIVVAFDACGDYLPHEELRGPFFLGEEPDVRVVRFGDQDVSFLNEPDDAHAEHVSVEAPEDDLVACFYP